MYCKCDECWVKKSSTVNLRLKYAWAKSDTTWICKMGTTRDVDELQESDNLLKKYEWQINRKEHTIFPQVLI